MDRVRVVAAFVGEVRERVLGDLVDLCLAGRRLLALFERVSGGGFPGAAPEDQEVRKRVPAEPVGTVHATCHLAGGIEALDGRTLGLGVDPYASHHVMAGRTDLHRPGGDVDVGELFELVVHRREPALYVLGWPARGDV